MTRITVIDGNSDFAGWYSAEAATEIARIKSDGTYTPYVHGKILIATAKGKLVINEWNNSGVDYHRFAEDKKEIAEILAGGCTTDQELTAELAEILEKYEL